MRMISSETLLSLAIKYIEEWSEIIAQISGYRSDFLSYTSHYRKRARNNMHISPLGELFSAMAQACIYHAQNDSQWWRCNASGLINSQEAAIQYMGISGFVANPQPNMDLVSCVLLQTRDDFLHKFEHELGELLKSTAPQLRPDDLDSLQSTILCLYEKDIGEEDNSLWIWKLRRDFLLKIPS